MYRKPYTNIDKICKIKYLEKENKKIEKKLKNKWLWDEKYLSSRILTYAKLENGDLDDDEYLLYKFHWLGLRLKFTDDEVRGLIDDFLHDIRHYDYTICGETIFQTMKRYGISYPEAIFEQYLNKTGYADANRYGDYPYLQNRMQNMLFATEVNEDGQIKYDFDSGNSLNKLTKEEREVLDDQLARKLQEFLSKKGEQI